MFRPLLKPPLSLRPGFSGEVLAVNDSPLEHVEYPLPNSEVVVCNRAHRGILYGVEFRAVDVQGHFLDTTTSALART